MESTNLHHLQDQPPPPPPVSSLSSTPSYTVGGTTTTHSWTPNITLNNAGNINSNNLQEANTRSRSSLTHKNNYMNHDLGYHHSHQWTSDVAAEESCLNSKQFNHNNNLDSEFSKNSTIKEEISFANFPKFTEMLNYTAPNSSMECYRILDPSTTNSTEMKNNNIDEHKDMNALMLKTLFTGGEFYNAENYPNFGDTSIPTPSRGNNNISSQIHPSIDISNLNHYSSSSATTSLDMNMQSLDLLTNSSTSFSANLQDHHHSRFTTHDHDNLSFHLHPMQHHHPTNMSSSTNSIHKPSLFRNGAAETKRGCTLMESKVSQSQTALKKSRSSSESRPSCPPFKVRKEN